MTKIEAVRIDRIFGYKNKYTIYEIMNMDEHIIPLYIKLQTLILDEHLLSSCSALKFCCYCLKKALTLIDDPHYINVYHALKEIIKTYNLVNDQKSLDRANCAFSEFLMAKNGVSFNCETYKKNRQELGLHYDIGTTVFYLPTVWDEEEEDCKGSLNIMAYKYYVALSGCRLDSEFKESQTIEKLINSEIRKKVILLLRKDGIYE